MPAIEAIGRAIFAQLAAATGPRAASSISVQASSGTPTLPRNAYLMPVVDGKMREHWLFKVGPNPATLQANGSGGDWAINSWAPQSIPVISNVGGAKHNLRAGTVMRLCEPIAGLPQSFTLQADATGAADGSVLDAHFFEDLTPNQAEADIFSARLARFPALMLVWESSESADGLTTGVQQGQTRAGRNKRFFRENFILFVVGGKDSGDQARRSQLLSVMELCSDLLTDQVSNIDGELLSTLGQLKINNRARIVRGASSYVYAVRFSVVRTWQAIDARTFTPWDFSRIVGELPGHAAPEPTAPAPIPDVTTAMLGSWTTSAGEPWTTSTGRPWRT